LNGISNYYADNLIYSTGHLPLIKNCDIYIWKDWIILFKYFLDNKKYSFVLKWNVIKVFSHNIVYSL